VSAIPSRRESLRKRGIHPGASWCEHVSAMLVTPTEMGKCYARCLLCLEIGPERTGSEAARQALQMLGAKGVGA
jgi:hypothetical protein